MSPSTNLPLKLLIGIIFYSFSFSFWEVLLL
jgi:hypothetical protein